MRLPEHELNVQSSLLAPIPRYFVSCIDCAVYGGYPRLVLVLPQVGRDCGYSHFGL
jgi:hypothetical protein